ncbi:MAG: iron ABC transporter permease [Anaerolineales bacterium]|nr:MAG: iron ABC transporter permease [Anaerolineales bacterium]
MGGSRTNASLEPVKPQGVRRYLPWIWSGSALIVMLFVSVAVGPVKIPLPDLGRMLFDLLPGLQLEADWSRTFATIVYQIRLPNTALMALAGMALGGSGAAYQGLFRNPLADPYIIGVASGAGLGAVLAMAANWPVSLLGMATVPLAAFIAALITVAIVYAIARVGRSTPVTTLILAGVAVSSFATAMTSLIMLLSTDELHRAVNWMVGGFALGGWEPVLVSLPYLLIGLAVLALLGRQLNVLQFGDEQARQMGLDVERSKLIIVVAASLVAATAVAFSGIIAFVGLIVPHVVRLLWGPDYRRTLPLAILVGGSFLLAADVVARVILAPRELPVGVITAVVGAPFFLWLLYQTKGMGRVW